MSHFTTIKTKIKDVNVLIKALNDLGHCNVEQYATPQPLYGYLGDIRPETAEVVIRRKYVGSASNDIGFQRQADGSFKAIISEFDRRKYNEEWINSLMQRYGYYKLIESAADESFTVEEEETLEDGTIRVVISRWV